MFQWLYLLQFQVFKKLFWYWWLWQESILSWVIIKIISYLTPCRIMVSYDLNSQNILSFLEKTKFVLLIASWMIIVPKDWIVCLMDHVGRNVNLIVIVLKITLVLVTELANKLVISIKKPVHPVNTVILIMKFVIIFANLIKNVPEAMLATNPSVIKTALYLMIVEMTRFVKSNLILLSSFPILLWRLKIIYYL